MKRMWLASVAALLASGAVAADDPIAARQELMKGNGNGAKTIAPMLKGATPFDLEKVDAALQQFIETSEKAPALFPEGSAKGKTHALPAIWQNKADFEARFKKLGEDSRTALANIKDEASLKASVPPIFKDCGGCHEQYRAKMP